MGRDSFECVSEFFIMSVLSSVIVVHLLIAFLILVAAVECDTRKQCSHYCGRDREWQDNTAHTVPS